MLPACISSHPCEPVVGERKCTHTFVDHETLLVVVISDNVSGLWRHATYTKVGTPTLAS